MNDTEIIDGLRKLCGWVQDGSATSITISLDDATRDYVFHIGSGTRPNKQWTWGSSFREACEKAITEFGEK